METQNSLIKQHLLSGRSITPIEALSLYGCFRLSARILDLKKQGLNIISRSVAVGEKKHVASYRIDP